ncbi:MAG: hypothetical protein P1V81_06700 [Planctomycetota bacterium]|nr:hypothetical protein [Planctomycetota bacterium]
MESPKHDQERSSTPRWVFGIWLLFAGLAVAWLPLRSFNWDALAYLGCVEELRGASVEELHASAYAALDSHAEPRVAESLRAKNDYRLACSSDPAAFADQLPFYRGRVLYLGAVAALASLGVAPVQALFLVSWLGGVGLLVASGLWVRRLALGARHGRPRRAVLAGVALLVLALGVAVDVPASGTPDALAAGLLVGGSYLLLEARRPRWGLLLLGLALATRADALVLVLPLTAWLYLRPRAARGPLSPGVLLVSSAGFVVVALSCTLGRGTFDLWTVVHHTFVAYQAHPAATTPALDLDRWWGLLLRANHWLRWEAVVFALAGAWALARGQGLALVALVGAGAHFVLFPALWPRLMLAYWVLLALAVARSGEAGPEADAEA